MTLTIGILHPGAMGSSIGAAAKAGGARVVWTSENRSQATKDRAAADSLEDVGSLADLVQQSDIILSICPPNAAKEVARNVMSLDFKGLYVDANAISPTTARAIGGLVQRGGVSFVDGGIIGPPARGKVETRLYLSGEEAERIATLFEPSALQAIAIGGDPSKASALKMAYAAWTKGTSALLLAVRAYAAQEGIEQELLEEWGHSQPGLTQRSESVMTRTPQKAWRFAGEMSEISSAFQAAGLPQGFHRAAEDIYTRLERFKGVEQAEGEEVLATLLGRANDAER